MATLLENWRNLAYGNGLDDKQREQLWTGYFTIEKGIYEADLKQPGRGCYRHCKKSWQTSTRPRF